MNCYSIANLKLRLENISSGYVYKRMKKYAAAEDGECDLTISYIRNDNIVLPEGRSIIGPHRWWNWINTPEKKYAAFQLYDVTKKAVSLMESDSEWKHVNLQLSEIDNEYGITAEDRFFTCAGDAFANFILRHNGFILHSSAIDYNGKGILFSAPSGTGKSTHTRLWKKHYGGVRIINDDSPAIRLENGKPYVFGTPWSGKTQINDNIASPIEAIVFIDKAEKNSIAEVKGARAVALMLSEARKSVFPEMLEPELELISKVVNCVPIYHLSCNISKEAVDLVKKTLEL